MQTLQDQLPVDDTHIRITERELPVPDGLHFGPFEDDTAFKRFYDLIIEIGLLVLLYDLYRITHQ